MTEQKKNVETIFTGALQRATAGERAAYLDGACGDDPALRARVEELLSAHEEADTFLSRPTAEARVVASPSGDSSAAEASSEGPGTRIGRYKLLQQIGEGGFGEVYMAEQEEPVRRKVALKIIKLGMDTKQVIGRFEAERQALAMMEHPNIAKVLDAGATANGRPYFVMELVKGIAFTEYCDKNNLGTRARLALFVPVCNAIQHAHNKGIIHRDIKPNNVLVTLHDGKPVPKVIDFGVAKATNQRLTEQTVFTEFRQFIGTPEYMSPEQAEMSGLDIDTRSDIYSLGVLLYEILTGTTPFDSKTLRKAGYVEITRMIREDEPPTPSTRLSMLGDDLSEIARHRHTEPGVLSKRMRGDLDWIVMTALEKDRTRRYETANALARDIEHHLKDEPVLASPPSAVYKFTKFVRRNRTVVMASSLVVAALLVGLALATLGFVQARRQRDAAEAARAQAVESEALVAQQRDRYQSVVESLQTTLAIVDPERVKELESASGQGVLDIAREVVTDASPLLVSFGAYSELDALRATNWTQVGDSVNRMNGAILKIARQIKQGRTPDSALRSVVQKENGRLVKIASGIVGLIPSNGIGGNGEFTHPLILINLMAGALEAAGQPLTSRQKAEAAEAGEAFERAYSRRQAIYTAETPMVEKLSDELGLKRDCMKRVEEVLTPEQREVVAIPEIQNRLQFDVLSPVSMVVILVKSKDARSKEQVRSRYPLRIAQGYDLDSNKLAAHTDLFDTWYEEIAPILETVADENEMPHIDQVIIAGRAQVNLIKALLRLDDLSDNTRDAMRGDPTWVVPRVTYAPIDKVRRKISELRDCCPLEERLADELLSLGTLLGDDESVEAISLLIESSEIFEKVLGDRWNPDPLRHQLRSVVRRIALDRDQSKESYEAALRGARVVLALKPTSAYSMNGLGVVQYRLGLYEEALATLSRSDELRSVRYEGGNAVDVGFIAMANLKLERQGKARAALDRLRKVMTSAENSDSAENQKVLSEAEELFEAEGSSPQ